MRTAPSRWIRAFLFGILAEVATIISIIITVQVYQRVVAPNLPPADYAAFGTRVGGIIGLTLGTVFVFILAWPVVRSVSRHKILHGVVAAVGAIVLQLSGSMAGHGTFPRAYLYAICLKLIAGAAAGWLAWRVPIRATA